MFLGNGLAEDLFIDKTIPSRLPMPSSPSPNMPTGFFGTAVTEAIAALNDKSLLRLIEDNLLLKALHRQTTNHLRHVSFTFETDSETYPHAPVLNGAYPYAPTRKALRKAHDFWKVIEGIETAAPDIAITDTAEDILQRQKSFIKDMTRDPLAAFTGFRDRLAAQGASASFPEFADVIHYLLITMRDSGEIKALARSNRYVTAYKHIVMNELYNACRPTAAQPAYAYARAIDAIERGVEFFDVIERSLQPEKSPPLYHTDRYEYYMHFLAAEMPTHVFFPTLVNLSATDLLKMRGVPVSLVGVNTKIERVDGFYQTPYEFFMHDVNHARRMYQFGREEAAKRGMDEMDFYTMSCDYLQKTLLSQIALKKADDKETREKKKVKKMILFECLHEDALPADPAVLRQSFLRPPCQLTPFEKIEGGKVIYVMEPGATTLAYVFRKLAHTFYDAPDARMDVIVNQAERSRDSIVQAAYDMFQELELGDIDINILKDYAYTDAGFPDDFRRDIEADITARALQKLNA